MVEPRVEPVEEIREIARRYDPQFTDVVFKKWRAAGLVPRPIARPGRGRGPGRGALYPAGTAEQLCRALDLRALAYSGGRRFQPRMARWQLWWEDWPIEAALIRSDLSDQCDAVAAFVDTMWRDGQPTAFCQERGTTLSAGNLPSPLREVRQRVGRRGFEATYFLLVELLAGAFRGWDEPADRKDFLRATGLDRGRQDRVGTVPPWLQGSLGTQLQTLSQLLRPSALRVALETTSNIQLIEAKRELLHLLGVLHQIRTLVEQLRGVGAFGLASVPDPGQLTPSLQQLLLLGWLSLRGQPELRDGYRAIAETAHRFLEVVDGETLHDSPKEQEHRALHDSSRSECPTQPR